MNNLMKSIQTALENGLTNGDLAEHIAKALGEPKSKTKINNAIKSYFKGETLDKKETKPKKETKKEDSDSEDEAKDFSKMKVSELKDLLKEKKLSTSGKKADLIERLESAGKESYLVHDNGGRPFLVDIDGNTVKIFKNPNEPDYSDDEADDKKDYTKLIKKYDNVQKIFVGEDDTEEDFKGNTVLFCIGKNRYVYVAEVIYEFTSPEEITEYYSRVGNSDVPYPVAVSEKYAYFMLELRYGVKSQFEENIVWKDAYQDYYEIAIEKKRNGKFSKFKNVKNIHKRLY